MTTWDLVGMQHHILLCNGSSCMKKGAEEVTLAVRDEITKLGLDEQIHTTRTKCNGRCKDACVVTAYPTGNWYNVPDEAAARTVVRELMQDGAKAHRVYTMQDGAIIRTEETPAIKGIAKNKQAGE